MEDSGSSQEIGFIQLISRILVLSERLVVSFPSLKVFKQRLGGNVDKVHASGEWLAFGTS